MIPTSCAREPLGCLPRERAGGERREATLAFEEGAEVLPREELHHEEETDHVVAPDVDHAHDVRARRRRRGPCLTLEARHNLGIARVVAVHDLDRDPLPRARVVGLQHRGHPADPDDPPDRVAPGDDAPHRLVRRDFGRREEARPHRERRRIARRRRVFVVKRERVRAHRVERTRVVSFRLCRARLGGAGDVNRNRGEILVRHLEIGRAYRRVDPNLAEHPATLGP